MPALSAMRWTGGKSVDSPTRTGPWIASLLPYRDVYAEPYAGMLGILLQRRASPFEVVNDLDGRVTNWWNVVRDDAEELARLVLDTPRGRPQFEWALIAQYDMGETAIRRALAFTIIIECSIGMPGVYGNDLRVITDWRRGLPDSLPLLKTRMRNVRIESRPAADILKELSDRQDAVIYVDPPYQGTAGFDGLYGHADPEDSAALPELLHAQRGADAISGYGDEWDGLGWERHEHSTYTPHAARRGKRAGARTEVLWTNFPDSQLGLSL